MDKNMNEKENEMNKVFEKARDVKMRPEEFGKLDNKVRAYMSANPVPVPSPIILPTIIAVFAIVGVVYFFAKPIIPKNDNIPPVLITPKPNQDTEPGGTTATSSPIKKDENKPEPKKDPENIPPGGTINTSNNIPGTSSLSGAL